MKKTALFLAAMMAVASMGFTSFAEEPIEMNWSDIEEVVEASGIEGSFVTFDEVAVQMWIPDVLLPVELTDEDVENGYIGYFAPEDESAAVAVMYVDAEGMDLDAYAELLAEDETISDVEPGILNGLACVTYSVEENDTNSIAFASDAGYILEVTFYPASDEGFSQLTGMMAMSIMPEEGYEATTEE